MHQKIVPKQKAYLWPKNNHKYNDKSSVSIVVINMYDKMTHLADQHIYVQM